MVVQAAVDQEQTSGNQNATVESKQRRPWLCIAVTALACTIFLAHAPLITAGNWRVDEYHDFGLFRARGWSFFFERLLTWSPRPLSETLVGLYFLAEEWLRRQLIVPFLALMWATLLVGPVLFVWQNRARGNDWSRSLIACSVLAMFLLGHRIAEMLYWPMGAVVYATTLAALSCLTFQIVDGRWQTRGGRLFGVALVLCAAGSAEVGAIFAIYFAVAMVLLHLSGRVGTRREGLLWLLPLLVAIGVMLMLAHGRGTLEEHVFYQGAAPNLRYLNHPLTSLRRSLPTYLTQLIVLDGGQSGAAASVWGFGIKALFFLGLLACMQGVRPQPGARLLLVALLLSLQATFLTSIAGSYYKFGLVCCERHDTFRQCIIVLTALSGAALIAAKAGPRLRLNTSRGAALIGLALLLLTIQRLPDLIAVYEVRPTLVKIRRANWASGTSAGDRMVFLMAPSPPIVDGMVPPEHASLSFDQDPPWLWQLIMTFFQKRHIELTPIPQPG